MPRPSYKLTRERETAVRRKRTRKTESEKSEQKKETLQRGETGTEHGQSWKTRPFSPLRITSRHLSSPQRQLDWNFTALQHGHIQFSEETHPQTAETSVLSTNYV